MGNETSKGRSRNQKWECRASKLIRVPIEREEWRHSLEMTAKELYSISYQLQEI